MLGMIREACEAPHWKSRVRGGSEDIFFLTTLDRTSGFVETVRSLADAHRYPATDIGVYLLMIKYGVASCKAVGHIMPSIPLHKGADCFMSSAQFDKFYRPTLRKVIIGLVNEGLVPQLFAEGGYNQRLEIISDLPHGGCPASGIGDPGHRSSAGRDRFCQRFIYDFRRRQETPLS